MISLLDLAHVYVLYLFSYIWIVSTWYKRARTMGLTTDAWPTPLVAFVFVMGGPAIWLAYPLAKRSRHVHG